MSEVLTLAEIEAKYPREWVIIVDHETDESHEVLRGRVLYHSPDRDEADRKLLEVRPKRFAFRYLGPLPEHTVTDLWIDIRGSSHQHQRSHRNRRSVVDEILTVKEMESRFPSEWVVIGDPETDAYQRLLSGRVLFHSPDRDEADSKLMELRPKSFAFRYLGPLPEYMAINLYP